MFETVPYQDAPIDEELRVACARSLHLLEPDGSCIVGADAVLEIYQALGQRWATVMRWPPMYWGMWLGYAILARNRRVFARWLFREEPPA